MSETATGWTVPMRKTYHVKRLIGSAVCAGAALLFAQSLFAQGFISREYRPRWMQEYENFGGYDLRKNPTYILQDFPTSNPNKVQTMGVLSRVTYDPFGNFLLPGGTVYDFKWDRSRVGTSYGFDGTYSSSVFNNIMISADEFSNWQTRFMISNNTYSSSSPIGMRAFFTPSTLKITNFSGIRWDLSSRKNNVTLLVQNNAGATAGNLYGVHWQSILGDILKVGGTFVSRQRGTQSYSNADIDNGTSGMRSSPRYVYLVLTDESPEDNDVGARIYDIQVWINGTDLTKQVPQRAFKITDILNRRRYYDNAFQKQYIFERTSGGFFPKKIEDNIANQDSWFLSIMGASSSQMYNDIFAKSTDAGNMGQINIADPTDPKNPQGRYFKADTSLGYLEANGTDVVIYEFLVPYETRDLKFKVLAANDYNIDIIAALYKATQETEAQWTDQPLTDAWKQKWSVIYDSKNAAKASGNVKDFSNTGWVTVQYDRFTGFNVYGLDAQFSWRGLNINAEINEFNAKWAYPLNEQLKGGSQSDQTARAWFVNIEKDFGKWAFGGELYDYPYGYMNVPISSYNTIDDNDDDDAYIGSYDTDDTPGYDIDWDREVDTAYSGTPYIQYYYDDVVFGDDFNHDGRIDARENDSAIDLPYERNSKGQHFFVKLKPREKSLVTVGYYDVKQGTLDGRNLTDYLKLEHFFSIGNLGEVSIQHRAEFLKYNYFRTYRWGVTGASYALPIAKNDFWNTTLLHTRLKPIDNLNIINDVLSKVKKYYSDPVLSWQNSILEHTITQTPPKKSTTDFTFVNKADYTINVTDRRLYPDVYFHGFRILKEKRIKELKIQPMVKYTHRYYTAFNVRLQEYYTHSYSTLYPVIRLDYRVAPNTLFRCGFQGVPGFPEMYRVRNVDRYYEYRLNEYDQRRMILAFENRTLYQGFNLYVIMGVSKTKKSWVYSSGRKEEGNTQYFITVKSESSK